jgi:hypothetical protein
VTTSEPIDPDAVLSEHLRLAGEAKHWKDILAGIVSQLTDVGYEGTTGEQTRAAVREYGAALDRLDKILSSVGRLGIEERLTRVAERDAERLSLVLRSAARALGLDMSEPRVIEAIQQAIAQTEPVAVTR